MITEISHKDQKQWNAMVKSFRNYEVFYMSEYVMAFMNEDKANGEPILLIYENGEDRVMNVVFRRDVAKDPRFKGKIENGKYFDLITPYGYGGFMGEIKEYERLNAEYNAYCKENNYICEFVRFNLFSRYHKYYDGQVFSATHNIVRDLEPSMDVMWMGFRQKVRKNVKRAVNSGLKILVEDTDAHLKDFLDIYYATMNRCGAQDEYYFSEQFFETLNNMNDNIMYFYVLFEGEIISTELVIYGGESAYSFLGGTKHDYFHLRPNDYLKLEIIKWCKEKGLKNFVLGGGYGSDDGIFQYKFCFAPEGVVDFYIGKKILDEEKYKELCELRGMKTEDLYEGFFPRYRLEGDE